MTRSEATAAGREWARREAALMRDQGRGIEGTWRGSTNDALALVEADDPSTRRDLAEDCNEAADREWSHIVSFEGDA